MLYERNDAGQLPAELARFAYPRTPQILQQVVEALIEPAKVRRCTLILTIAWNLANYFDSGYFTQPSYEEDALLARCWKG
jgi:hypothetical protein